MDRPADMFGSYFYDGANDSGTSDDDDTTLRNEKIAIVGVSALAILFIILKYKK